MMFERTIRFILILYLGVAIGYAWKTYQVIKGEENERSRSSDYIGTISDARKF
jgi:hypothetical protein